MTIIYLTLCWAGGIIFAELLDERWPYGIAATILACLLVLFRDRKDWRLPIACALFFALGGLRLQEALPEKSPDHISHLNNQGIVTIFGVVSDAPDVHETYTNVRVKVDEAIWLGKQQPREGLVLVRLPAQTNVQYGDRLLVTGQLFPPPELDTFSYQEKLAREGVFSIMQVQTFQKLDENEGRWWKEDLLDLRDHTRGFIEDALPEPQASLLSGILLGDDSRLSEEVRDAFNTTGTAHVIAISGFNMTLIAAIVKSLLSNLLPKKSWAIFFSLVVIAIYTIFVGANAAVVRAAIMSGLLISADGMRRKTYAPASLAFAALIMSILNPYVLWDIGFQLSFAAVLGLALLANPADTAFRKWMQRHFGQSAGGEASKFLSEPLVVGMVAQISTLPIILFYFGRLSVYSPVVNLLVVPVQSFVLIFGGMATLVSFIYVPAGTWLYTAAWLFLTWTTTMVRAFADLPGASLQIFLPQWFLIIFGVSAIGLAILTATRPRWYEKLLKERRQQFSLALKFVPLVIGTIILGLIIQALVRQPDGELHVTYLDMGQSNSALIESPDGAVFLIDGGRYPSRLLTALGDHLPPNNHQIDVLWITSDQPEDINALLTVVERYNIQAAVTSVGDTTEADYYNLIQTLQHHKTPIIHAEAGYQIETGDGVKMTIVAPHETAHALVLRLQYGESVFLFTNDLSEKDEQMLLSDSHHLIQASVLQAADHAAPDSNSAAWVEAVNPQVVVVQYDPASRDPGADSGVLARFSNRKLYRTDRDGTIEMVTDGKKLKIYTEEN
ncbi:MAG: ComEC/Rec2 family competence protein [Chloroflexi bacterium]|nr:ComEC/Rec2 family competence protein [Chloroflexota bacterium]